MWVKKNVRFYLINLIEYIKHLIFEFILSFVQTQTLNLNKYFFFKSNFFTILKLL